MRFTCQVKEFRAALETANRAVPSKSPKPILFNVKLVAVAAGSTIEATNLEFAIRADVPGLAVDRAGECLLPAALTLDILRSASDETLIVESDGKTVRIEGSAAEWEIPFEQLELYPQLPAFPDGPTVRLVAADFLRCVKRSIYAVDEAFKQYALSGCLAEFGEGLFGLTATDGRQLAHCEAPCEGDAVSEDSHQRVIPARILKDVGAILDEAGGPVELAFPDPSWCHVRQGGLVVSSRLVSGRFPRWREIAKFLPPVAARIEVEVGKFRPALEQAGLVVSEATRGLDFAFGPGRLTLAGLSEGKGRSKVVLPLDYDGPELILAFDPHYLLGALKTFGSDERLIIELFDERSQLNLVSDGFLHYAMPMAKEAP